VITSLLIDLDDTLLTNDIDIFIPAYLKLLSQRLDPIVPAEKMIQQLHLGTQAMISNRNLDKTLAEVFDENFFPALGLSRETLMPYFDAFYAEEFGKLQHLTSPTPAAHRLITYALENQLEIVIATNPLFPLTAIEQRLAWAGLPVTQYPYTLITSYETFHFAKPKLEYITEILAKCGRHPHEAVMIGNDPLLDLPPAAELGTGVFHISDDTDGPYPRGDLDTAVQWLQESPPDPDPTRCTSPQALLARLRGNLIVFNELENMVQEDQWQYKSSSDDWAPIEVLCHLRDVEREINYPRIQRILKEHEPFLSALDSDRWAKERDYINESKSQASQALSQARRLSLSLLELQSPSSWNRLARHAIFGPTKLSELIRIFLEHDILHIRQIKETIATITSTE
jgi:FMN phosphatase YigB (HAD superfamily)